jgi:NAD(P)H-dependent FMN reductase
MTILILNCSPRREGVTTTILRAIADSIASTQVKWVNVNDLAIRPCTGCLECRPDKKCTLPYDDAHRVGELIEKSDLLIVGTPTYWGNITGPLKLLFDRNVSTFQYVGTGLPKPRQKGKKAILVTASSAPFPANLLPCWSGGTLRALRTVLHAGGYRIVKTINVPNASHFDRVKAVVLRKAERIGRGVAVYPRPFLTDIDKPLPPAVPPQFGA